METELASLLSLLHYDLSNRSSSQKVPDSSVSELRDWMSEVEDLLWPVGSRFDSALVVVVR